MIKNKKLIFALVIFSILFYASWAVVELILKNAFASFFKDEVVMALIRDTLIKNLLWTLPALLLIKHFEKDMYVGLKEMRSFKRSDITTLLLLLVFLTVYVLLGVFIRKRSLPINENFGTDDIIVVLFVGITEELVFRGWLLNSMLKNPDTDMKKYIALGINAVMFLIIHFPIWISNGSFVTNFTSVSFLSILLLSAVFGMSFIRTKNIFVPIILHSFYDLLVFMFV